MRWLLHTDIYRVLFKDWPSNYIQTEIYRLKFTDWHLQTGLQTRWHLWHWLLLTEIYRLTFTDWSSNYVKFTVLILQPYIYWLTFTNWHLQTGLQTIWHLLTDIYRLTLPTDIYKLAFILGGIYIMVFIE